MKVLCVQQNFPGQYLHLARHLGLQPEHQIVFITQRQEIELPGVRKIVYKPRRTISPQVHHYLRESEAVRLFVLVGIERDNWSLQELLASPGIEDMVERMSIFYRGGTAVFLLVIVCLGARASEAPPKPIVYLGGTLIDGTAAGAQMNMAVVIQGDRIVAVRPAEGFSPEQGQEVVDVRGKFLIPGLINTHVHVATLADARLAKAYLRRELYSGVTSVRDMAGDSRLLVELKREAEFDEIAAPDIDFVALMAGPEFFTDPRSHDAARSRSTMPQ